MRGSGLSRLPGNQARRVSIVSHGKKPSTRVITRKHGPKNKEPTSLSPNKASYEQIFLCWPGVPRRMCDPAGYEFLEMGSGRLNTRLAKAEGSQGEGQAHGARPGTAGRAPGPYTEIQEQLALSRIGSRLKTKPQSTRSGEIPRKGDANLKTLFEASKEPPKSLFDTGWRNTGPDFSSTHRSEVFSLAES